MIFSVCVIVLGCTSNNSSVSDTDDTVYLQSLLDSPEPIILIPSRKTPWITRPLSVHTFNKIIIFEKGCRVYAKKGAFLDVEDCLIEIGNCFNVLIIGNGALLKMCKNDYESEPYRKGQWRHGISIKNSKNISVEGLTVSSTGGDGIYIGQKSSEEVCENIVLKNLALGNNYRQGISVISVKNFLMEGCRVFGTDGNLPMAGIDFEPNSNVYGYTGCLIKNCSFTDNSGSGIQVYLKKMERTQIPVEIMIENTKSRNNNISVAVFEVPENVRGLIRFSGCTISGMKWIQVPKSFSVVIAQP